MIVKMLYVYSSMLKVCKEYWSWNESHCTRKIIFVTENQLDVINKQFKKKKIVIRRRGDSPEVAYLVHDPLVVEHACPLEVVGFDAADVVGALSLQVLHQLVHRRLEHEETYGNHAVFAKNMQDSGNVFLNATGPVDSQV